jgi:2-oxo-3-hexenedioate decarboxylase/2-keto-4-pentenoate hydratase
MQRAQAAAETLMTEHSQRVPFHNIEGISDLAEAYEVQRNYVRLGLGSDRVAGYKIGLTSATMQTMCGIDQPIAGAIFSRNVHPGGARIALQDYFRLGLEFEICARLKDDLPPKGSAYTRGEVSGAAGHVCAAVELIEDRCADYASLDCKSVVADNAWNAGIVLAHLIHLEVDGCSLSA